MCKRTVKGKGKDKLIKESITDHQPLTTKNNGGELYHYE